MSRSSTTAASPYVQPSAGAPDAHLAVALAAAHPGASCCNASATGGTSSRAQGGARPQRWTPQRSLQTGSGARLKWGRGEEWALGKVEPPVTGGAGGRQAKPTGEGTQGGSAAAAQRVTAPGPIERDLFQNARQAMRCRRALLRRAANAGQEAVPADRSRAQRGRQLHQLGHEALPRHSRQAAACSAGFKRRQYRTGLLCADAQLPGPPTRACVALGPALVRRHTRAGVSEGQQDAGRQADARQRAPQQAEQQAQGQPPAVICRATLAVYKYV